MLTLALPRPNRSPLPFVILAALLFSHLAFLINQPHALPLPQPTAEQLAPGGVPAGLTSAEWQSITTQIASGPYSAYPTPEGHVVSANPAQGWQITYAADGTTGLTPRDPHAAPWQWGLRLNGYGFAAPIPAPAMPIALQPDGQRMTYRWDAVLDEWWQNGPNGLEQGFTVHSRPDGWAAGQPLRVLLDVQSGLEAVPFDDGLAFQNAAGNTLLTYTKLYAWDATGRTLPATLHFDDRQIQLIVDDHGAQYPLTIDPLVQQAYLKASNTDAEDQFGITVAISGDTIVVGAPSEDSNAVGVNGNQADNSAANAGAAYVFVRSNGAWIQQAYLKASNTNPDDQFGGAVAISGDTIVVGAVREAGSAVGVNGNQADNNAASAGAAYVFVRSNGAWTQQAYLKASNTDPGDEFGQAVAISGDTIVVGAYFEASSATGVNGNQADNSAARAGAAYVFVRSNGAWTQQAYLKASNTDPEDLFGLSMAIDGDTIVVGTSLEAGNATGVNGNQADNSAASAGAAYVFVRSNDAWTQQAYLKASNTDPEDEFGGSVAISGDTIVVGARFESSNATGVNGNQANNLALATGAAYVFVRNDGAWSQQAYLKASNPNEGDSFGSAVAIAGDTIVVGAPGESSNAVGVNGNQANNSVPLSGAAYTFVRSNGAWSQQAYFKASNPNEGDAFSSAIAISGDTIVAGASLEDGAASGVNSDQADNSADDAGAAYTFALDATPPSVTINQAADQDDPTGGSTIRFTVVFSEAVTGFTAGDVVLSGTAPGTLTADVSGSGDTYTVSVSGMSGAGTVIAAIPADAAQDAAGNLSLAAASTDNTVAYDPTLPPPQFRAYLPFIAQTSAATPVATQKQPRPLAMRAV